MIRQKKKDLQKRKKALKQADDTSKIWEEKCKRQNNIVSKHEENTTAIENKSSPKITQLEV